MAAFKSLVAAALLSLVLACGPSDNEYNSPSNFGGPNQCLPYGYTSQEDKGQITEANLRTQCTAKCGSLGASACQFVWLQLQCAPNGLCTGQCFYYPSVPSAPQTCANYPTKVIGLARDNSNKCLSSSAAAATQYCSSYLSIGTITSYTATTTPTFVATTTVATVTMTVCPSAGSKRRSVEKRHVLVPRAMITAAPLGPLLVARDAAPPACLTTSSLPASRISSACSCLGITSTTLRTISTAPTYTTTTSVTSTATYNPPEYTSFVINAIIGGVTYNVQADRTIDEGVRGLYWKDQGQTLTYSNGFNLAGGTIYAVYGNTRYPYAIKTDQRGPGIIAILNRQSEALTCSITPVTNVITCVGATRGAVSFKDYYFEQSDRYNSNFIGAAPDATGADITLIAGALVPGCKP